MKADCFWDTVIQDDDTDSSVGNDERYRHIDINGQRTLKYCKNTVSSTKYNIFTFLPKFLFEQFTIFSNCFFLLIALIQQIPGVSPIGKWTVLFPLVFILMVSAVKEIAEDWKRYKVDREINNRLVEVLRGGKWKKKKWKDLKVGDICKVQRDNFFPADLILLSSSESIGISYIETSNLDGESNLKIRQALPDTAWLTNSEDLFKYRATITCEEPNRHIYGFIGNIKEDQKRFSLCSDQLMLRGSKLKNTSWIVGITVYTGCDTKLALNSTKPRTKKSRVHRICDQQTFIFFWILGAFCLFMTTMHDLWYKGHANNWYIGGDAEQSFMLDFVTNFILLHNLIPISVQVTAEIVRFCQAILISWDVEMYYEKTDTRAMARTSNLNEELGMINNIFTDKTGTLTCNIMKFKKCCIAETVYYPPDTLEDLTLSLLHQNLTGHYKNKNFIRDFLTLLTVCHTVITEEDANGMIHYHAASPDDKALVLGAIKFGYIFENRTLHSIDVAHMGISKRFEILDVLNFTSTRQRMSVIVKTPEGHIKLYIKGSDSVIFDRLSSKGSVFGNIVKYHLNKFAMEGFRTLCCAVRDIPEKVYKNWKRTYCKAKRSFREREKAVERAMELIEKDLLLLGATAIEDKLQDGVPETLKILNEAGIKIWVLTGDKKETAINIGYASGLITQQMGVIVIDEENFGNTREKILLNVERFGENLGKPNDISLIVEGKSLKYALSESLKEHFFSLCSSCKTVICCRVAPIQKAEVVEKLTRFTKSVSLAIGDGANDVAMIQKANVGVGISGLEGLQAVNASDYSIAQFRYLQRLLLVHGVWNSFRISKLILYMFYKNIVLNIIFVWFGIYSGWSGQILCEKWSISLYNVCFTALSPFCMGVFDRVLSADAMLRHPEMYALCQSGKLFNRKIFWLWIANSVFHSVFLFWISMLAADRHILWNHGRDGGYLVLGNMIFTYVIITVCVKAAFMTISWTWLTHAALWTSISLWILFLIVYSKTWPLFAIQAEKVGVGSELVGMEEMMFTTPVFWLGLILIPFMTLAIDLFTNATKHTIFANVFQFILEDKARKNSRSWWPKCLCFRRESY